MIDKIKQASSEGQARSISLRVLGMLTAGVALLASADAGAVYLYDWQPSSGSYFRSSFQVPDAAIGGGLITAPNMKAFSAMTEVGAFTTLEPSSSLAVNPTNGVVDVASSDECTSTNGTDTLLVSASGFSVPTSRLLPCGRGTWAVIHVPDPVVPLQLASLNLSNGHMQFQVTSSSNVTFAILASTDLTQWTPLLTNQTINGVSSVTDPDPAAGPARFYRAVILP